MENMVNLVTTLAETTNNKDHPVPVKSVDGASNLSGITYVSSGNYFTCALTYDQKYSTAGDSNS